VTAVLDDAKNAIISGIVRVQSIHRLHIGLYPKRSFTRIICRRN